ncbi:MAG: hypothetical protein AB7W59_17575 [Acidimicrobiia bacterium]
MLSKLISKGPARRFSPAGLFASAVTLAAGLLAGACGGEASSPALLSTLPTISATVVTTDVAAVQDCTTLAGSLAPMFAGLGDLSADEANRLDPAVIRQIGAYLDAVENRRLALGCDEAAWVTDSCKAMAAAGSALAERFLSSQCVAGPRLTPEAGGPGTTVDGTTPATATAPGR